MVDYWYKYFRKLPHLITTMNTRNNRSIDSQPNLVNNSDFMSIPYSRPLREYKEPKFGFGEKVRISIQEKFV